MADCGRSVVYTIGTSLRSIEEFVETLLAFGIKAIVDVRSFPKSKLPYFSRQGLEEIAASNGLVYCFFGRELGGLRKEGYAAYMTTDAFALGISRLEQIARESVSAVLCAERLPWKCHRKWISLELQKRGWQVRHIIDKDRVWTPQ